jgi:hypothetical protein
VQQNLSLEESDENITLVEGEEGLEAHDLLWGWWYLPQFYAWIHRRWYRVSIPLSYRFLRKSGRLIWTDLLQIYALLPLRCELRAYIHHFGASVWSTQENGRPWWSISTCRLDDWGHTLWLYNETTPSSTAFSWSFRISLLR